MKRVTACALALLCALMAIALLRAPAVFFPASISVLLKPGEAVTLGQHELAAPQADRRHVAVRRDEFGRWWVSNVSDTRQLVLQRGSEDSRMGSSVPQTGQQFQIGASAFSVVASSADAVEFVSGETRWRYDGKTLLRNGGEQPPCPGTRWAWVKRWFARPLVFGGNLACDNKLGIAGVDAGSATINRVHGRLMLTAVSRAPLMIRSGGDSFDLARHEEALADVSALYAGHTRLAARIEGDRLVLRPSSHVALLTDTRRPLPRQVAWQWQQRENWNGAAWWIALAACGALVATTGAGSLLLAAAGLAALLLQRSGSAPAIGVSLVLAMWALWCCLLTPRRVGLATCAGVLLLAIGLLAQLELGLGAMESSWLRHFQKTTALLAIGLGASAFIAQQVRRRPALIPQSRLEWLLMLLAGCALIALLLQVAFGDETGVFDLQPVEFAKLALTALTAHCLAIGMGWHASLPEHVRPLLRWIRLSAPAILFAALLAVALVQVDDYSPLILLLVWTMTMALAWSLASRRHLATAGLLGVGLLAIGAIVFLRSAGPDEVAQWSFYGDRFLVWLDPANHPHTGQQLLLGARAVAEGAWWGADSTLGLGSLGQSAGTALHIPQVQDDFAPSFFLNRHGLVGALVLWTLQALFVMGLLQTAARAFAASRAARDFRLAWWGRFRCFALCGGAAFVLGHLLLSWGTNLAIFPIMGQPMSFLSAGGSHLLFFICPLLGFSAISVQSLEESSSCRSMSNTKY